MHHSRNWLGIVQLEKVQAEMALVRLALAHMHEGSSSEHSYSGKVCTKQSPYEIAVSAHQCHGD
jgi:hypothetical protein